MPDRRQPVVLVILDGWGCAPPGPGNAVELAETPVFNRLWAAYPHTTIKASGEAVGLPAGQMGNSEVGHLTIGSGRILDQDLQRINRAIADGSFFENPALKAAFDRGGDVHLLGLVSHGGVHSHIEHLQALLRFAPERTWIHAFTDGRDVSPHAAEHDLAELPAERIATVAGRYYAMDRDQRWERTQKAFDAIVEGKGEHADDPVAAVRASYERGITDEFIEPTVLDGRPRLGRDDAAIFFNFRPDRARQLTKLLLDAGIDVTTMTRYSDELDSTVAFGEQQVDETLAEVLAEHGLRQLHAAETEKYAHVTYFFNGGREQEWPGETRLLVPSPRDVGTYDKKPEMSAEEAGRPFLRGARARRLQLRGRQLRQPRHGRPHRRDPGRRQSGRDHGRLPRPRGRDGRAAGRRLPDHGRPRQRGADARAGRREPAHGAHDEPRAVDRHRPGRAAPRRRRAGRSRPDRSRLPGAKETFTDVGQNLCN